MAFREAEFSEYGERTASVLDIGEMSPARIAQLKLKLAEYQKRDLRYAYQHPDLQFITRGTGLYQTPVLDYVLAAATDPERDLSAKQITISEVATAMEEVFKVDLSVSKTADFLWSEERPGVVFPDFDKLIENGSAHDVAFSEAYGIIRAYCVGDKQGVVGGTGLPDVPAESE